MMQPFPQAGRLVFCRTTTAQSSSTKQPISNFPPCFFVPRTATVAVAHVLLFVTVLVRTPALLWYCLVVVLLLLVVLE